MVLKIGDLRHNARTFEVPGIGIIPGFPEFPGFPNRHSHQLSCLYQRRVMNVEVTYVF